MPDTTAAPYRKVEIWPAEVVLERRGDGVLDVVSPHALPAYPDKLTERLEHWARTTPDAVFVARRHNGGDWRRLTYRDTLDAVRRIGTSLLARGLSPERPIAILSENDIEHLLLALAAMYVGIPYAPISPAYALVSSDFGKLRHIIGRLTPGLVFASDGQRYAKAIAAAVPADAEIVVTDRPPPGRPATAFADLLGATATATADAAHDKVGPDTIAKVLFTSGSTGNPKGVINTQRMLCSNQVMVCCAFPFLAHEPPVIVDWLPWNHTFGGNHNVGIVLYNGGTLHIDDGRPVPGLIEETIRNLREIAPTLYFNVPKGYEMLTHQLAREPTLRELFFSRLKMNFFAGASLAQHVWDALDELSVASTGERVVMMSGLGATETGPSAMFCTQGNVRSGSIGLPLPGVRLKLVPNAGKLEARVKGPAITPGYWREPELTAKAFDDEGYYCFGDAVRFADPADPKLGFVFDGRIAEDFKLATGTWVSVGPLRARFIAAFAPFARDVVITGLDRDFLGAILIPDVDACRAAAPGLPATAPLTDVLASEMLQSQLRARLAALAVAATGSSNRIQRVAVLASPPAIDVGEITDKGSINQRAVLAHRVALVEDLHAARPPAHVIAIDSRPG